MHKKLAKYYSIEILKASTAYNDGAFELAFSHLERAHILGQKNTKAHLLSHWWMFKIAVKQQKFTAMLGQALRMLAALVFSKLWVPVGNTGGTNVSAFKTMPLPDDLAKILAKYS